MTVPPADETVLAPDSDVAVVELEPPDEVDVEEPPGTVVDTGRLELVEESGVVDEDDEFGLVEVVALITGAPGESLTSSEAAPTTAQVAAVTRIVAASQPSA